MTSTTSLSRDPLLAEVLQGLALPQKTLPPTLFYDARGSELFLRITEVDEYYVTRAEEELLREHGGEMAAMWIRGDERVVVIEPGCGASTKVAALLRHLPVAAYIGVDVSSEVLQDGVAAIAATFPDAIVRGVVADYHAEVALPDLPEGQRVAFFPGSTVGNFHPPDAVAFLERLGRMVGPEGCVLVGVDLWKDRQTLAAAYDDALGITAAFNKNALTHLNARYGADFDLSAFDHESQVNSTDRRVEMHLRSTRDQTVHVAGSTFHFATGETVHTENSYKYTVEGFQGLARRAGLEPTAVWTDGGKRMSMMAFRPGRAA